MTTLYQKYRPSNFQEIVNQNHIKITLQNEIETNQMAHAYLFSGPRGTGKTTMARVLAKAVNCEKRGAGESEPCGQCASCQQITNGTSLDIIEIDAASHTGVDNVRENIISNARIAVSNKRHKIFIIDEVHMLSISAFNALLKTLEEPPQNVIFILCTTEIHKMPTTIISRCQRFDFKRINVGDITQKLEYIARKEEVKIDRSVLETIARNSDGHMRDAESLLGQVFSISGQEITQEKADLVIPRSNLESAVSLIEFLSNKDGAQAIRLVNQLVDEGVDLKQLTEDLIELLRRMLLAKISVNLAEKFSQDVGQNLEGRIQPLIKKMSAEHLVKVISDFQQAQIDIKTSFIAQLPLEIVIVEICSSGPVSADFFQPVKGSPTALPPADAGKISPLPVQIDEVRAKWNEILLKVKKYNHSLSFILKICEPRDIDGSLCLVFKYKFHRDRIEQAGIRQLVDKAIQEIFGHPVIFTTGLDENMDIANGLNIPNNVNREENPPESSGNSETEKENGQEDTSGKEQNKGNNNVDNILKMFGGKVIQ
ncbi:hypothetical protein COT99_03220 [Candidatus Falkowbacteria bacterium CG10_big_fil_rev_8_21_14_0_10_43_10]|uniref:DNA polymerase III subunit gamma/tau n=1 Tax=Candidatus Falkowbacteria bacterium CG10_big_fil_rev_8_21_14_0_10_43_10 TaxID=1974567 RepID=A0A2H0V1N3_9BACT|nr:MAG: hypothetical protein COT99_03220 [Candidatus Falkowbacteria bacterium CG10_big_fil_rev_8_21_14_0_10_43_10]